MLRRRWFEGRLPRGFLISTSCACSILPPVISVFHVSKYSKSKVCPKKFAQTDFDGKCGPAGPILVDHGKSGLAGPLFAPDQNFRYSSTKLESKLNILYFFGLVLVILQHDDVV